MLHELHIRNFAIIDDLHLHFAPGLNILTGETGAGKSIIIDAVGLLLGDRALTEWVRFGADRAEIEATFYLPATNELMAAVRALVEAEGLDDPDNPAWLLLSREVRRNGRNVARVNGRAVSLQILSDLTARLVDIHGQGEHLSLLRPRTHINLLDRYAGLVGMRAEVAALAADLRAVRGELQRLRQDARTIVQRVDMLHFQVAEIAEANLQPGENSELDAERRRLGNAKSLMRLAQEGQALLTDNDADGGREMPSAVDLVSEAVGRLDKLAGIDPDMMEMAGIGQGLLEQLGDLAQDLQDYAEQLEFNPTRLHEVEERLELIAVLKRKYGDTIDQIVTFGEQAQAELDALGDWEVKTAELDAREESLLHTIGDLAATLSEKRRAAGETMARQVEQELTDLRMDRARFGVAVHQAERSDGVYLPDGRRVAFDATGVDRVEFLISANPGEPLKPMVKVASGGETARLMLALKSVLAHADATPTLIFDEIDQGIGGRVGGVVGEKLWRLTGPAGNGDKPGEYQADHGEEIPAHQVLCITHLPQLAAFGDQHFTVNKQILTVDGDERTRTQVQALDAPARVEELTHMLGATTAAGRLSVEEMLAEVDRVKEQGTPAVTP